MCKQFLRRLFLVWLIAMSAGWLRAQEQKIDLQRSLLTIHVGKSGLFSAAGHEHWVHAPFAGGSFSADTPAHVAFRVDARTLTVMPDPQLSTDKQAEVQKTMHAEVLESEKYPEITFRSTKIDLVQASHWLVTGDLTLHGQTRSIRVDVNAASEGYTGSARFKQTDFGIRPVSVGGLVKVKNELDIEFKVLPDGKGTTSLGKASH